MRTESGLVFLLLVRLVSTQDDNISSDLRSFSAQQPIRKALHGLSRPLIGDDRRIYACSEKTLFAFENNGTISWSFPLNYTCKLDMAPISGGRAKLYLVAEDKVLKIDFWNVGTSGPTTEVFFGPEPGQEGPGDIIGVSVSTSGSSVYITVKNRGLFAYTSNRQLRWSAGPVLYRSGYRQGCRRNVTDCYFASVPVIDRCEASIYIVNTEGELYSISVRSPYFKWIQDFSSFDNNFTVTPGNNGHLYVTVPDKALMLALDVTTGNVLWQQSIGPVSTRDCTPVIDVNGWISIGSLDGFLYSFSPAGVLKKFPRAATMPDFVIQANPLLDCSGYGVYFSRTEMEGKISHTIGDYTYVSATKPANVVFSLLIPATGSLYWMEIYSGQFLSEMPTRELKQFALDERTLLAFVAASNVGNPLPCRTPYQKLMFTCSQASPKHLNIYTGNERAIWLFLLFESIVLLVLAGLVRFCCVFWRKRKLRGHHLGQFLEIRHFLQLKKKAVDRTIVELERKTVEEEAVAGEVLEKLSDLVRERERIERKLLTTYSFGKDETSSRPRSVLPLYDEKPESRSFQSAKTESITLFHAAGDTSSGDSSCKLAIQGKELQAGYSSDYSTSEGDGTRILSARAFSERSEAKLPDEGENTDPVQLQNSWLKRRRTMPSTR